MAFCMYSAPSSYLSRAGYTAANNLPVCSPGSAGAGYVGTSYDTASSQSQAQAICTSTCDSLRSSCESVIITGLGFDLWQCDYYGGSLPAQGLQDPCYGSSANADTIFGIYKVTIKDCFAASQAQASSFCSTFLGVTESVGVTLSVIDTATVDNPVTQPSYVASYITQTLFMTTSVTTTATGLAPSPGVSTVTATATVTQSICDLDTGSPLPSPTAIRKRDEARQFLIKKVPPQITAAPDPSLAIAASHVPRRPSPRVAERLGPRGKIAGLPIMAVLSFYTCCE